MKIISYNYVKKQGLFLTKQKNKAIFWYLCKWVKFISYFSKLINESAYYKPVSLSLFVKHYFSAFCNFLKSSNKIFYLLGEFYIVRDHIAASCFFPFSERSWYLSRSFFETFLCFLIMFSWRIFRYFYIWV